MKDETVICDVLDALATNLDGTRSAPEYFLRRRRVLHRVPAYAIRKKRLDRNPVGKGKLDYFRWTDGQHRLWLDYDGRFGLSDADCAAVRERAADRPGECDTEAGR